MSSTSDPVSRSAPTGVSALLGVGPAGGGHFDELRESNGALRERWRRFVEAAGDLSGPALAHAAARIARQMHEHGVTYNVYESAEGPVRPWALDALPMLIDADEWAALDAPLRQQARLLNALAADLYGDRRVLVDQLLPAALVFGHRGFVRGAAAATPAGAIHVHVAALDLARAPDGHWHLMGVRVQAPSGLGYALENRATLARIFPDALRHLHVRPLGAFANLMINALTAHAPSNGDEPRAVILTPGPYNETYFEHLYLARHLGLALVQGGDLTVRQDRVFLKTVAGLRPVHAIWRRVDDDFCDPLELRSDSTLGVAGLLQAWRSGRVLIANAFGLGILESPALLPHFPVLADRLLAEPLALPVVSTGWQPSDAGREGLTASLSDAVIKPALAATGTDPVGGRLLDSAARSSWMNRLEANPAAYAVQNVVPLSCAPVWHSGTLESRPLMLRVFLITDGRGDYQVLPGALTRVALGDRLSVSAQRGGASKDTWVLADGPIDDHVHRPVRELAPAPGGRRTVTSRAAEHLFWLGRYAERSENAARLIRTILARLAEGGPLPAPLLACMVRTCGEEGLLTAGELTDSAATPNAFPPATLSAMLAEGVFEGSARAGLSFSVSQTTRAAAAVRERLSYDNWRVLTQLARRLARRPRASTTLDEALEAVDDAILSLVAAGGLEMAHMTRDDGWRFLSLGRHLERLAFVSATLIGVAEENGGDEPAVLDWVLELSDSLITYRTRYRRLPDWSAVMALLLLDVRNPRAILFQIGKLAKHTRLLPGEALADLVGELEAVERFSGAGPDSDDPPDLQMPKDAAGTLLVTCHELAQRVSDALTLQYFSHVSDAQHATVNA